jgi:hypothetical protein
MKSIVQIELTNHCSRRCSYCGQSNMKRERGFMSPIILRKCIQILNTLGQFTIAIHHYGESFLHQSYIEYIDALNMHGIKPSIYTNGDFLTDAMIEKLSTRQIAELIISAHRPQESRIELWQKCSEKGIKSYWQQDITDPLDLAGQVETANKLPLLQNPAKQCKFLVEERCCVLWNGDLVPCCYDYEGIGIFGNIMDDNVMKLKPFANRLCASCSGHPGSVLPIK